MNYIYLFQKLILLFFLTIIILKSLINIKTNEKDKKNKNEDNTIKIRNIKDVLFINGCNEKFLPHPYRYRVLHQIEQLNTGLLESDVYYYLNFEPNIICNYRVIIFYRCPWNEKVDKALKLEKILNKKVLFDIDDLVIDTKYTDNIPYIKSLTPEKKAEYDNGVQLIGKTLKLCDAAITTTEGLANEIKNYIPNVFINRNVASEEMWKLSQIALNKKINKTNNENIIIGYFSGSITHDSDIEMIKPALIKILKEFNNVQLLLSGVITYPDDLKIFNNKIIKKNFTDWRELPEIISKVDINIAPIEDTIFNEAKSENKWVEASLVKIPTIASNVGAFKKVIVHNETGLLCNNINEWYISLKTLINNEILRKYIGENAYNESKLKYNTIYSAKKLLNFINSIANKHIGFYIPTLLNYEGNYIILKHACILQDNGWDVDIILPNISINLFQNHTFNIIGLNKSIINTQYDILVATFYSSIFTTLNYYKTKKHLYLVQNCETDFYSYGNNYRIFAEKTHLIQFNIEYITISKWCQDWLFEKYGKRAKYAPNGIDIKNITPYKRNLTKNKIRILIEVDCNSHYKNVDESFKIAEKLNKNKFEIWYLTNNGKPKDLYRVDRFFNEISHEQAIEIYKQSDILIKSTYFVSFSYQPLEMMTTGGYCIVAPNESNKEYLKDGENCLFYKLGDINDLISCINRLISDEKLQKKLYINGLETAQKRDWNNYKDKIIALYED